MELWRRESYFVDDNPTDGGKYDLVYDKVLSFHLQYYAPTDDRGENEDPLTKWDTKVQKKLPYAIVVQLDYLVHPPTKEKNLAPDGKVKRIILLTPARSVAPDAAMSSMDTSMTTMR